MKVVLQSDLEKYLRSRLVALEQSKVLLEQRLKTGIFNHEEFRSLHEDLASIPKQISEVKAMLAFAIRTAVDQEAAVGAEEGDSAWKS